jgi:hypothetical protein
MNGLNDKEIARVPIKSMGQGKMGHEKGNGRMVLERQPDYIMLRSNPNPEVNKIAPPDKELDNLPVAQIWGERSFHRDYEPFLVKIGENVSYTIYRRIADGGKDQEG